jgi:hypothetical protein
LPGYTLLVSVLEGMQKLFEHMSNMRRAMLTLAELVGSPISARTVLGLPRQSLVDFYQPE